MPQCCMDGRSKNDGVGGHYFEVIRPKMSAKHQTSSCIEFISSPYDGWSHFIKDSGIDLIAALVCVNLLT